MISLGKPGICESESSQKASIRRMNGYATTRDYGKGIPARHSTCCNDRRRADGAPAENQIHGASDDDPEQPAEVRPAQKPGNLYVPTWVGAQTLPKKGE